MRFATPLALLLLFAAPVLAQPATKALPTSDGFAFRGGDACDLGDARADLTFGDTRARLFNKGNLFYDGGSPLYEVPKEGDISPMFAAGIWVGGLVDGELRIAAATYAQGAEDYEFWPGPLDDAGNPPDDCEPFDRIWTVDVREIEQYDATGAATPDLAEWPADLGAPVADGDGVPDNYNLEGGDRPLLYGHETSFWVMNDAGGFHATTLSEPIELEVRVSAFSIASEEDALRQGTFYRYELDYRGDAPLEDGFFTLWTDPDLGNFSDDYIGTDTTRGMGFVYNADNDDEASAGGYGLNPPALGVDFLSGAGHTMYSNGSSDPRTGNPDTAEDFYNYMQAQWMDGTPLTLGGGGTDPDGTPIDFVYPGDPVEPAYWSEICPTPDCSVSIEPNDRRFLISTPSFSLQPGETKTVDFAILFAQGADHLDSVTELRAASDAVQSRYDAGTLFAPFPSPPALQAPEPLAPADGALITDQAVAFSWSSVPGAELYALKVSSEAGTLIDITEETAGTYIPVVPPNTVVPVTWRVRAEDDEAVGPYSEPRSFQYYRFAFDFFGSGVGIVETASPTGEVCPAGTDDPGCADYDGNTVWLDPNASGDYALTTENNLLDDVVDADIIDDDDFEMRFTEDCMPFGSCLGAYIRDGQTVVSVPFELWNVGDPGDASDDVRMIPLIRPHENNPLTDWSDTFTASQPLEDGGEAVPVTDRVFFMMPDRPNGYALFEDAAIAFGGPGAVYDPAEDGDTQIDLNSAGTECVRQGWYVDFCYNDVPPYRAPIGHNDGLYVADIAGDGTTPPAGTVVRFDSVERLFPVANEGDGLAAPEAFALEAAYPNPFRASSTVTYRLERAADVRLAVYDVLGRRVTVLTEGRVAAGAHRATLDGAGLASGVYLVVLEAEGERQARKVLLVR